MKKFLSMLMILGCAGTLLADHDATRFVCRDGERLFKLRIHAQTDAIETIMLFDDVTSWTPLNAQVQSLKYVAAMAGHSGDIDGQSSEAMLVFSLPEHRPVSVTQTGGYYIPEIRTVPFEFVLNLELIKNGARYTYDFDCQGV